MAIEVEAFMDETLAGAEGRTEEEFSAFVDERVIILWDDAMPDNQWGTLTDKQKNSAKAAFASYMIQHVLSKPSHDFVALELSEEEQETLIAEVAVASRAAEKTPEAQHAVMLEYAEKHYRIGMERNKRADMVPWEELGPRVQARLCEHLAGFVLKHLKRNVH